MSKQLLMFLPICSLLTGSAFAALPDLDATGLRGGWLTVVGTTDGATESALAELPNWLIHGLALDQGDLAKARETIYRKNLSPRVKISLLQNTGRLPYADHLVNVLIVESTQLRRSGLTKEEILRVLAPKGRGVAFVGKDGAWEQWTKPMPEEFDAFPSWRHGADGNMLSRDRAVDVPNSMRFIAGPRLQDANGANPWRVGDGVAVCEWNNTVNSKSSVYYLEARDAFNGTLLWQRTMDVPREQIKGAKGKPMVITNGRVIISDPTKQGRLVALDLFTGREQMEYEHSVSTEHLIQFCVHQGKIYEVHRQQLQCIDLVSGKLDWTTEYSDADGLARPVVAEDLGLLIVLEAKKKIYGHDKTPKLHRFVGGRYPEIYSTGMVAFRLKDGGKVWRTPINTKLKDWRQVEPDTKYKQSGPRELHYFHSLTYREGRAYALFANDANRGDPSVVWAVDAATGKDLWASACGPPGDQTREMFDLFALDDGTIFTIGHAWARLDAKTGELLAKGGMGGNPRCDTHCGTVNLITAGFGNVFKLHPKQPGHVEWTRTDITRGQCGGRLTPAYGMTYHMGSGCGCFTMVRGNLALQTVPPVEPLPDDQRRVTGPALDAALADDPVATDWPVYLGTSDRRGWSDHDGPASLKLLWQQKVAEPLHRGVMGPTADVLNTGIYNGPVTAPVVANGMVVIADRESHRVAGLDAASGEPKWCYQADGRVITPPTLSKGRVVFGDRQGYVHCLELRTGRLAWRFLAAPVQQYMMAYGQTESPWPLHGCLPVVGGTVVATAGYHGETDGGVWAWGLNLASGEVKWSKSLRRTPRQWQVAKRNTRSEANVPVLEVRDVEGEFSVKNGSGYFQTVPLNIELPSSVGNIAQSAKVHLDAATGTLASSPGSRILYRERYPFLDMESENRGGPHGSGGWTIQFGGVQIGDTRGGQMRIVVDEKTAYIARPHYHPQLRKFGLVVYRYDADNMPDGGRLKRVAMRESDLFAFYPDFYVMDSFVVAGGRAYAAAEGVTERVNWHKVKQRRVYKGEPADGSLLVIDRATGDELHRLPVESAVINNGLAVAGGRLYAACEDGFLRCYRDGE